VRAAATVIGRAPIGRYRIAHALRRFAGPPFLMQLPAALGGYTFHCDIRDTVSREVCFTGRYEPQETQLAARLLAAGMTAVDAGANWGYFTLAAASWVGASGRVIAFEPEPRLFALLAGNVARNRLRQASVRRLGLAGTAGRAGFTAFREERGNWGISQAVATGGTADFECATAPLDETLDAEGVARVDLLKIDVEGAEADVLQGMTAGLASCRYRYILLECHPALLTARGLSIADCLLPAVLAGYRVRLIDHSVDAHRRSATRNVPIADLLLPFDPTAPPPYWPHLLLMAPGVPEPI
jgi:FkbM family methyltransferase